MKRMSAKNGLLISVINRQLKSRYPGPHGPRYWLLADGDNIVVRGWRMETNGKPMGEHLAVCGTVGDALIWITARGAG